MSTITRVAPVSLLLGFVSSCHHLYDADIDALDQEVRLSVLAAGHQTDGGVGQLLDYSNACAARAIQVRHGLKATDAGPNAKCPQ